MPRTAAGLSDQQPHDMDLLTHLGLIGLCRSDGLDGAYALVEDPDRPNVGGETSSPPT